MLKLKKLTLIILISTTCLTPLISALPQGAAVRIPLSVATSIAGGVAIGVFLRSYMDYSEYRKLLSPNPANSARSSSDGSFIGGNPWAYKYRAIRHLKIAACSGLIAFAGVVGLYKAFYSK